MILNPLHLATRTARLTALALAAVVLTGCQGITGSQQIAQVRVIDASPDAPNLDIYQNSPSQNSPGALYNIGFGTVSSYMSVPTGAYTHSAFNAGTQQQLAQVRGSFANGGQYTVLAGNIAANLQMTVFRDQSMPAPAGQMALRFLGQATHSGPVDIYLLPPGFSLAGAAPFATGVSFGSNTGYINAPSGTYSIVAFPTGLAPTAAPPTYTGSQVTYPATSVRTILLLDQPPAGLQTITASDFDPATS
jgi:hypothetical protein